MDPQHAAAELEAERRRMFEEQRRRRLERFAAEAATAGMPAADRAGPGDGVSTLQTGVQDLHLFPPNPPDGPASGGGGGAQSSFKAAVPSRTSNLTGIKRTALTEGHAKLGPTAKRTRPSDLTNPHTPSVPPPTSSSAAAAAAAVGKRPRAVRAAGAAAAPAFPSLARLPVASLSSAADANPPPLKGKGDDWQHKALWLERRAQAERAASGGSGGAAAAGAGPEDAMDVVDGAVGIATLASPADAWVPLPPRQREGRRRRQRGLSVEMAGME